MKDAERMSRQAHSRGVKNPVNFYRGCRGKEAYPSRRVALGIVRVMQDPDLHAYRCRVCKKWHLGH